MREGRPQVVVRLSGGLIINQVVKLAKQLGYTVVKSEEIPSTLGTTYAVTFARTSKA